MSPSIKATEALHVVRSQLLNQLLVVYLFFGVLVFIVATRLVVTYGWSSFNIVQLLSAATLILTALVRDHLSLRAKGILLLLSFTALGLNSLFAIGLAGRGTILLILACLVAFFALGRRAGQLCGLVGLGFIGVIGYSQAAGVLPESSPEPTIALLRQTNWFNALVFYGFVVASLMIMLSRFQYLAENLLTKEQQYTAQLQASKQDAEIANSAKTDFLGRMSHELRTPLNAILGFTQLLQMNPEEQRDSRIESIRFAGEHLLGLINEALDVIVIEEGKLVLYEADVDLRPIIDECLTLMSSPAEDAGVSLHTDLGNEPLTVHGDALRIRQVILNLLSNAVKYNQPRGSVHLQARATDKNQIEIEIIDTGIGIADQDYDKVFEIFTRFGDKQTEVDGTGVGLTISRQLVELMGGEMDFISDIGVGSTFRFTLPR